MGREVSGMSGPVRTGAGHSIHVGDRIVTRQNDRAIKTDRGVAVRNRATWTVTLVRHDGAVDATGADGNIRLLADYVRRAVELGYAQTIHGAQGATVDRSILVIDTPADGRGIYVGLTRGAKRNDAIVLADDNRNAIDVLAASLIQDWTDRPATRVQRELIDRPISEGRTVDAFTGADRASPELTVAEFADLLRPEIPDWPQDAVQRSRKPHRSPERGMGMGL
jgi:hypothetical protein